MLIQEPNLYCITVNGTVRGTVIMNINCASGAVLEI